MTQSLPIEDGQGMGASADADRAVAASPSSPSVSPLRASIPSADQEICMIETAWRSLRGLDVGGRERALVYLAQRLLPDAPKDATPEHAPTIKRGKLPYSPKLDAIMDAVAAASGVTVATMQTASRKAPVCRARFAAMLLMREAGAVVVAIGRALGGRDHTTVVHGLRKAAALRETDPAFAALVERAAISSARGGQ